MLEQIRLDAQFAKVSEYRHEVTGVIAAETPDRSGEILDYERSKPHFTEWSKSQFADSRGKSKGNVRRMHQLDTVGKIVRLEFDDANKRIYATAKISDSRTWNDIKEGVLTGFSIGGRYVEIHKDGALTRYTAAPFEVSVVDRPCIPGATFDLIHSDGTVEIRKFAPRDEAETLLRAVKEYLERPNSALPRQGTTGEQDEWGQLEAAKPNPLEGDSPQNERKGGVRQDEGGEDDPYLNDSKGATQAKAEIEKREFSGDQRKELAGEGKALPDGSFPIANVSDLENAIRAIGRAKDPDKAKAHVKSRAKSLGRSDLIPDTWKADSGDTASAVLPHNEIQEITAMDELEKGTKKRASQRLAELRDMHKAHFSAMDSALDGVIKTIAGPDSAMSEGNSMQNRSGEIVSQAKPAISFNPQEPTSIGKLAKRLGVSEENLVKAVNDTNAESGHVDVEQIEARVQATVEKTMTDILSRVFGAPPANDAVRGPGAGLTRVSRDEDTRAAGPAVKADEEELPPPPGADPRMAALYKTAASMKPSTPSDGAVIGLSKIQ